MKKESLVLTDIQMTHKIRKMVKGDNRHKDAVENDWLIFSYKTWQNDSRSNQFIKSINSWLSHHRLPLTVTDFTRFDEEEGGTVEWVVDIYIHD